MLELADELDQALASMWRGDSAAIEQLVVTHDEFGPATGLTSNGHGVGDVLRDAAQWIKRSHSQFAMPVIPGFEIVREIGRGGMGVVYEALQKSPQRTVAIKVIAPVYGADEYHRGLFDREIRALASLEHPGIASLHQAGVTPDGQAFFVMELLRGLDVIQFCGEHRLSTARRIELFCDICDAVQHAHMRGVIHRDLKPSNILVIEQTADVRDGEGAKPSPQERLTTRWHPKVLDFGLARLLQSDQRESLTRDASHIKGTLAYMSPEQMSGRHDEVDARSDVYSLGVILFELLADRLPIDLVGKSLPEAVRMLEDREPPPLGKVNRECRGDLEVIAATTLARDQARRYQSAAQLAEYLRRFLRHEPIMARPASAMYLLRKFARRHRAAVTGACVALAALVVGLVMTTLAMVQARTAQREAQRSQATSQQVTAFLNTMLASPDPEVTRRRDFSVRTMLEDAVKRLDAGLLAGQPRAEAGLRATIGRSFISLGLYPAAITQLKSAVDHDVEINLEPTADGAQVMLSLARALMRNDEPKPALAVVDAAIERVGRLSPADERLAIEAQHVRAWAMQRVGVRDEPRQLVRSLRARAARLDGEDSTLVAELRFSEAYMGEDQAGAIAMMQQSLATFRRALDPDDDRIARTLVNLGFLLSAAKRNQEAIAALQESLDIRERVYGPEHPVVAVSIYNLGHYHRMGGRHEQARAMYQRALGIQRATLVEGHYDLGRTQFQLGRTLMRLGRLDEAEQRLREALAVFDERGSRDHRYVLDVRRYLADCLAQQGDFEEAERLMLANLSTIASIDPLVPEYLNEWLVGMFSLRERWGMTVRAAPADTLEASQPDMP